ncbi:hypothetical protein NDU88_000008 [Pleurodeles waltl]|uniref:Uncharacterized protein n=1 Tax=Pleurodeles waltl TaxID=8319 RepID=A0AAV7KNR4_PLEWA|nr:hypothetical protein NDU88_000008 [Pleurodeles waltl]
MPPKPFRNLGEKIEKIEGVKVTRAGRGKGEQTGTNKRLMTIAAKPAGENMLSSVKTRKDPQAVEWGKDNSDKFYSLTEESDLSSGDHSLGGSEDSETSETENKTSSNEPTVRQLRRQRKAVNTRPCAQGPLENVLASGGRTLKWDYSGIGLTDSSSITIQGSANGNKESDIGPPTYGPSAMGAEVGMLQSIYSSIKELQTETRIESRRARVATKKLQGTVRKVAKSCTEIESKLSLMEERIVAVEEDVVNLKEQNTMKDEQLTDEMTGTLAEPSNDVASQASLKRALDPQK